MSKSTNSKSTKKINGNHRGGDKAVGKAASKQAVSYKEKLRSRRAGGVLNYQVLSPSGISQDRDTVDVVDAADAIDSATDKLYEVHVNGLQLQSSNWFIEHGKSERSLGVHRNDTIKKFIVSDRSAKRAAAKLREHLERVGYDLSGATIVLPTTRLSPDSLAVLDTPLMSHRLHTEISLPAKLEKMLRNSMKTQSKKFSDRAREQMKEALSKKISSMFRIGELQLIEVCKVPQYRRSY